MGKGLMLHVRLQRALDPGEHEQLWSRVKIQKYKAFANVHSSTDNTTTAPLPPPPPRPTGRARLMSPVMCHENDTSCVTLDIATNLGAAARTRSTTAATPPGKLLCTYIMS